LERARANKEEQDKLEGARADKTIKKKNTQKTWFYMK
jgi:hypothetical protein